MEVGLEAEARQVLANLGLIVKVSVPCDWWRPTQLVEGELEAEARQVFANLCHVLKVSVPVTGGGLPSWWRESRRPRPGRSLPTSAMYSR